MADVEFSSATPTGKVANLSVIKTDIYPQAVEKFETLEPYTLRAISPHLAPSLKN